MDSADASRPVAPTLAAGPATATAAEAVMAGDAALTPAAAVSGPALDTPAAAAPNDASDPEVLTRSVLGWLHRHPLAERAVADQVGGFGLVHVPLGDGGVALFSARPFIPGLTRRRVLAFVKRHGHESKPGPEDWPIRDLEADPEASPGPVYSHWLVTAAIQLPGREPLRVLIGKPYQDKKQRWRVPVLGRRMWSRKRVATAAGAAALAMALCGLSLWWLLRSFAPQVSPPGSAASAAGVAPAASVVEPEHASSEPQSERTDKPDTPEAPEAPASTPAAPAPAEAEATPAGSPATPPARSWALVTAPTWRKAELERSRRLLAEALKSQGSTLQVEVMHTEQGWVLTVWPLAGSDVAEALAARLRRQGLAMVVVDF